MNEEQRERKNEYNRRRYAEERARDLAAAREKDKIKQRARRSHPIHGEKVRQRDREHYAKNREAIRAKTREWYAKNIGNMRDKARAYHHAQYVNGRIQYRLQHAFASAKARAKKRGIEFSLKLSELGLPTHCAVTGIEFVMTGSFRQGNIFVPSLDRIDPAKGYIPGNVRVVVHGYNLAKHTGTDSDVLKLARALVKAFPE
jgi:hypothetical protein